MASNRALLLDFDLGEIADAFATRCSNSANEIASWAADIDKRNQSLAPPEISEIRRTLIDRELFEKTA